MKFLKILACQETAERHRERIKSEIEAETIGNREKVEFENHHLWYDREDTYWSPVLIRIDQIRGIRSTYLDEYSIIVWGEMSEHETVVPLRVSKLEQVIAEHAGQICTL